MDKKSRDDVLVHIKIHNQNKV